MVNNINISLNNVLTEKYGLQVCTVICHWMGTTATAKVPVHLSTVWWRVLAVFMRMMTKRIMTAAHHLYLSLSPLHLGTVLHHENTSPLLTRYCFLSLNTIQGVLLKRSDAIICTVQYIYKNELIMRGFRYSTSNRELFGFDFFKTFSMVIKNFASTTQFRLFGYLQI